MAFKKYAKKAYTAVKKVAKKRYGTKTGGVRMTQLMRDVALVKRSLNVEKKDIESSVSLNTNIGQVNGLATRADGYWDITPAIIQGSGHSQMTGNSVKLVSMALKGQVTQMSGTAHPIKLKMYIFKNTGITQAASTVQNSNYFLDLNPITGLPDYQSSRNVNFFKDLKVIKTQTLTLDPDSTSGEIMIKNFSFISKLSHHLK